MQIRFLASTVLAIFSMSPALAADGPDAGSAERGSALIDAVIEAVGSMDELRKRNDVQYTYVFESPDGSARDVSTERYIFDGELSWAEYTERNFRMRPELDGDFIEGWDGETVWVTLKGKRVNDGDLIGRARFSRKTNFYWFAMMQKLDDPGVRHRYEGTRVVDGTSYECVRVTFDDDVGDVQDTYFLYINPETKLVDRFLFTVMAFGVDQPQMMVVDYKDFDGIKLPVERRLAISNWDGEVPEGAQWVRESMQDIRFDQGFKPELFAAPAFPDGSKESRDPRASALIAALIDKVGTMEELSARKDVAYTYFFQNEDGSVRDISKERYIFDGELSWADYEERDFNNMPEVKGRIVQGWDGETAWVTLDGKRTDQHRLVRRSRFLRRTNYYWFAMMQKLADPGVNYAYGGTREVDGKSYEIVRVTFGDRVGDAQDVYVLYINPETKLVDRFLFTVAYFSNFSYPFMMFVEYEDFDGIKLPVDRKFARSDWDGNVTENPQWQRELMRDIRFNVGLKRELFAPPPMPPKG